MLWLEWLVEAAREGVGSFDGWQRAVSKPNKIKADAVAGAACVWLRGIGDEKSTCTLEHL